jgi:tRNA(fMet)-specific endonuclease VapC
LTYLLDTNVCVEYLNGRSRRVIEGFQRHSPADIVVCSIVRAELNYGVQRSRNPQDALAKLETFLAPYGSLFFDDRCAEAYGRIRARLAEMGSLIGPNDLPSAASALAHGATLVTHNVREFSRVDGLVYEDWEV